MGVRADCFPDAFPALPAARNGGYWSRSPCRLKTCGLSLSGCRRISGRTRNAPGKQSACGRPFSRLHGIKVLAPIAVQAQGLAAFRLAAVAAYPEERETPRENSQPAADRSPRTFSVLPAARNKSIGPDRRAGSRPCGLSLSGCRRISGRTRKTSGKYPALRAGCFPDASPVLPAARLVALEKSCH